MGDRSRSGKESPYDLLRVKAVIDATCSPNREVALIGVVARWAVAQGIGKSTVSTIWRSHNIKPHRTESFKLSRESEVLGEAYRRGRSVPESSGQGDGAVYRRKEPNSGAGSHPAGLPIKKGRCGTMTHDYKRNGTTTLFAALDVIEGKVIGDCYSVTGIRSS